MRLPAGLLSGLPAGLIVTGALFCAAPLGAGMAGANAFAILPFAGLFFLWVPLMRSRPFAGGGAFLLPALMLHSALASLLLGLGQLLRALLGLQVDTSLALWLALGLAALALGRLIWRPRAELEAGPRLEAVLRGIHLLTRNGGPHTKPERSPDEH